MGNNVSVLLQDNAPVPSIVVSTQHEVRASSDLGNGDGGASEPNQPSLLSVGSVVERCPTIRVMATNKAHELLGGSGSASVTREAMWSPPPSPSLSAEEQPVLLVEDCAAPDTFTSSSTYVPVLNAIFAYVEEHRKVCPAPADAQRGSSSSRAVCPIGIEFDPTLYLGERLSRSETRADFAEYCELFFTHLIIALESAAKRAQADASPATMSTPSYTRAAPGVGTAEGVPPRLAILHLDARSCGLDDTTGPWLASSLIMRAVRRTRPYAIVSARASVAGGGEDGFMSYFSPGVKADMMWASLQHVLLTHNSMSLQGIKAVLENLLAEDAMHDVLLQQQGIDVKAQKSMEVMRAVTQGCLFPRQTSQLLPELYLVDVRHNQYSDAEVLMFQQIIRDSAKDESARTQGTGTALPSEMPAPTPGPAPSASSSSTVFADTAAVPPQQSPEGSSSASHVSPTEYSQADTDNYHNAAHSYVQSPLLQEQQHTAAEQTSATPTGTPTVALAVNQTRWPGKNPPQCYVLQTPRSKHDDTYGYANLPGEVSSGQLGNSRDGAAPEASFASNPSRSITPSQVFSLATPPLTPRGELRKAQPGHRPSGIRVRSRQLSPESSRRSDLTKVDVSATAIDKVPDGLVMSRSARILRSLSPHSELRVKAPVETSSTPATQQQTSTPQSPGVLNTRTPASSPHRVDTEVLQRTYKVLKAQLSEGASKAPVAATPSQSTTRRQRMPTPRSPRLNCGKAELGGAEVELQNLPLHQHHRPSLHLQHHLWQRGTRGDHSPSSGRAEDELWIDEVYTQSHGRGTSPDLGTSSRRRYYGIPALAPPVPPFASSARAPTAMLAAGLRKCRETPPQVASRWASPASARRWLRTTYEDIKRRVISPRHLHKERLEMAQYEAAAAAETRAREWMRKCSVQLSSSGLNSESSHSVSAPQHPVRQPSPSLQVESGVTCGEHPSLSDLLSPSPVPQRPAAELGVEAEATSSVRPTDLNGESASAHTSSAHEKPHADAATTPSAEQDSPALQYHRPSTEAPMTTIPTKFRLSTALPPHIAPRGTVTSQLRKVIKQRQRRFSEVEEHENTYHARNWQPQTKHRPTSVTAAMRAPWAQPEEMAAVLYDQKRRAIANSLRGDAAPQRGWDPSVHSASRNESLALAPAQVQGLWKPATVVSTPAYTEHGREPVHMKLRTRGRAAC
ncbi:hypothetical protein NXY56_000344 [Leishmania guyanensis]